jgi:hypothetical protein
MTRSLLEETACRRICLDAIGAAPSFRDLAGWGDNRKRGGECQTHTIGNALAHLLGGQSDVKSRESDHMPKRSTTTKGIGLVRQLFEASQLRLAPEFQRNAVWPRAAKAYLIDTILSERPMPLFFFQRARSAQTGKPAYSIVDGQQRLRAIFEFMEDRFSLTESNDRRWKGKRFSELTPEHQDNLVNYDLTIEELTGYSDDDIRNIFVRMNKYVVKLSPQELRHARDHGRVY